MSLLQMRDTTIRFGGLVAVKDVAFDVEEGDLFGLIGPNGAGKTTCFNLITGVYEPTSGDILFGGKSISGKKPNEIAQLGICRTFQNIRLFQALSALENVVVGAFLRHKSTLAEALTLMPRAMSESHYLRQNSLRLLDAFELENMASHRAADLPYGVQRRLEIARAMATVPKL